MGRPGVVEESVAVGLWLEWERTGIRSRLPLSRPLTIGRDSACDVCLPEATVSRRHAVVRLMPDGPFVDATGSTNGIALDGGPANQAALGLGQVFRITRDD